MLQELDEQLIAPTLGPMIAQLIGYLVDSAKDMGPRNDAAGRYDSLPAASPSYPRQFWIHVDCRWLKIKVAEFNTMPFLGIWLG